MKTYKSNLPEITLKLKKGETLKCQIKSSQDACNVFKKIWDIDSLDIYESVICLFLNRNNGTIGWLKVSQGGLSGTVIDSRLVLTTALTCCAHAIILAHNHPSGNLNPSEADSKITNKIKEGCELFDIRLLDHLIITEESYYSFADNGLV